MVHNPLRRTLVFSALMTLAGCGFQMRQAVVIPYKTIFLTGPMTQELRQYLARLLKTGLNSTVVARADEAELILSVTETPGKQILSYDANGNINGYRIIEKATIAVTNRDGDELIPPSEIFLTRDMDFSVSTPAAAAELEILLLTDMRQDISAQVLRRLATLGTKKPVVQ
jgi:LPS-assembly lipoprotein